MNFKEKLEKITKKNNSLLCIGLDIDKEKIPKHVFVEIKKWVFACFKNMFWYFFFVNI
jgi:orotidine-5'-phosphate decarboxylase